MLHFKVTRSILSVNESNMTLAFVYSSYYIDNSVSTLKWGPRGWGRLQISRYILWTIDDTHESDVENAENMTQ